MDSTGLAEIILGYQKMSDFFVTEDHFGADTSPHSRHLGRNKVNQETDRKRKKTT